MATLQGLQSKIAKLQAQADAIVKKQSSAVIGQIHKLMEDHGLTVADLQGTNSSVRARGSRLSKDIKAESSGAKYQDPKSGATWTGHGRAPAWIASAKDRSKFLIDGSATALPKAAKESASVKGNYVRGPQPAKYRDPKTGAEWSGRGKAPSWLAGAKDRSKFLIEATQESASEQKTATEKAASKKRARKQGPEGVTAAKPAKTGVTTKKAAAKKAAAKKVSAEKVSAKRAAPSRAAGAAKKGPKSNATQRVASKKAGGRKAASQAEAASKVPAESLVASPEASEASAPV